VIVGAPLLDSHQNTASNEREKRGNFVGRTTFLW
jgi:hypothetical protein